MHNRNRRLHNAKKPRRTGAGAFVISLCRELAEPPDLLVEDNAKKVDEPNDGSTDNKNDGNNDTDHVACNQASEKTVNVPNDVKHGDAKNQLNEPGEIVHGFDEIFHDSLHKELKFSI